MKTQKFALCSYKLFAVMVFLTGSLSLSAQVFSKDACDVFLDRQIELFKDYAFAVKMCAINSIYCDSAQDTYRLYELNHQDLIRCQSLNP